MFMEVGNIGWVGKMEENTELEEGEACYNKDRDDNIDLDSLSYIDERIEHVLGHFQKDFEGGVSAENLGAKFGGYGSFLPAHECSPFRSHPKTSQKNYMSPKSPYSQHVEAASDNSTAPPHVPPSKRLGTAPCIANSLQNARAFSVDGSNNKGVGISSNIGAETCSLNNDSTNKSGKSAVQRTLKFRIKMKSDNLAQKNAAIYSGLGLDISPSSSMDNSPLETGGMPLVSQQTGEESPTGLIQAMTSFPITEGVLISPLQDSMLYLSRREKIHRDRKSLSSRNGQEPCSMSKDESDSIRGEEDLLKKQKVRILHPKKIFGDKTPERKDFLFNDLKGTPLFSSFCDAGETAEVIGRASEVSKKVNKDGAKGRMVSTEAVKEESLESMSGHDFDKNGKKHMGNGSMQRIIGHKQENSLKNSSVGSKNNGRVKGSIDYQKVEVDVMKFFEDSQKVVTKKKGKPLSDVKHKFKGNQRPSKAVAIAKKDSLKAGNKEMINNSKSSGFSDGSKSKMAKTKLSKDNNVGGSSAHSLKHDGLECMVGTDAVDGSTYDNFTDESAYKVKIKERQSNDKKEKLISGQGIKDALNACPVAGNKSAPEMVHMVAAPQVIEENWVCCDHCQKWRLLPVGIKPDQLPEKWLCSMLNWLPPGMNRCDISEEMTTKALYASCQMPTSEGLNNIQSNVSGAAIGVGSADAGHLGLSHQNSSFDALPDQRKKKLGSKEKKRAEICTDNLLSADSTQHKGRESGKIPSCELPAEGNLARKPVFQQQSKLNGLMEVKHPPKEKEKKMNGGDGKPGKLKRKMEADIYQPRTLKKPKTEDIYSTDTQPSPGIDLEMVAQNSRNGFPAKASGKDMQKYDEYCLSEDVQDKLAGPLKKQGDQTQILSNGGSLDLKSHNKKGSSLKKRKLGDWQDGDKLHNMSLQDDRQDDSASGSRKEKKIRVLNPEGISFTETEIKINRKDEMNQVCLSGSKNHVAVGAEVGSVDNVYPQRKHIEKVASHKVLDDVDPLSRDLGSGLLSLAATSSSSKVSGSHKCRTNYADMKSSPVESVTSSPLKISNDREGKLSVKVKEERVSCGLHSESLKFASIGSQVGDAKDKAEIQAKTSEVRNNNLRNFDVAIVQQHGDSANCESRVNKCNQESALSGEKSGKVSSLSVKEEDKKSGSEVDRNKTKVSSSENGYFKNGGRQESAIEPNYDAFNQGSKNNAKCGFAQSKCEGKKNSARHWSSEIGKQTELRRKDSEKSNLKVDASFSTSKEILSQENLIQDLRHGNKADTVCTESQDGKLKVLLSSVGEEKRETLSDSRTAWESKKGDTFTECLIEASTNVDVSKLTKISAGGVNCSSGTSGPDRQLPGVFPVRTNYSQTAHDTLKEAMNLKDRADHFKNSGFEFESNETFFKAALKFLHGASLLENFHKESSKHGSISQMQTYTTAAKLFASCAHEYERHHDISAATLAYKCMEVAYMRVVYSKHSSINRDRNELQSTLHMVPQGESPSSSASDVDNLNNQAAMDKLTLLRGSVTHVAGNQVISARRLLDFTQDVNFAMEASIKCQTAFAAANVVMEEARNGDCITSMRRVIEMSFHDVDELVGLVYMAMKAISRAHLGSARD